ncbi:MAG TPA: riboflavin synthase [Geobacteraceae bacterium]|nr:riboflavin synthase [Geobacteraceae bacterium]
MFTGLIEEVGRVLKVERSGPSARLTVTTGFPPDQIRIGDSIAVNGACLTVVEKGGGTFTFDASPETIHRTAFRNLKGGSAVNLERALRLSDRLDGHLVAGHVDCVAVISERREVSGNILFTFRIPREFIRYVAEKGSVAIDGISLTVNSVTDDAFSVNIIPLTSAKTTLADRKVGDEVNIETDMLCKYVERLIKYSDGKERGEGLSLELLAKNGFL